MSSVTRCCDTGRPIVIDPGTKRTVCSCQIQKGVPSYLSRVPTLPETVYGTGNSVYSQANMLSAMYRMYGQDNPGDNVTLTGGVTHPVMPMNTHAIAAHPYGFGYPGFDIHGARRKNATRETTSPLKAWLYTHKKNPYPTKAEKIMLAIVTRMTLTQVSTWFANARRRLKKENRLNGNDDDSLSDISGKDDRIDIDTSTEQLFQDDDDVASKTGNVSDISENSDSLEQNTKKDRLGKKCVQKLFSPDGRNELYLERIASPELSEAIEHSNTEEVYIDVQAPPVKEKDILEQTRSATLEAQQNDIIRLRMLDRMPEKPELNLAKQKTVAPPQQKPKIWSIAQIIA